MGKVLRIVKLKTDSRIKAVVEGINIVKKHTKQSATSKGGIESIEMPIHLCKLALQDPKTSKPTRVGFKKLEDGKKVRFAKKSGETSQLVLGINYGKIKKILSNSTKR